MNYRLLLMLGFLACAPASTLQIMGYTLRFSALGWGLVSLSFLLKADFEKTDFLMIGTALFAAAAGFIAPLPWYVSVQGIALGLSSLLLLSGKGPFRFVYVALLLTSGFLAAAPIALPLLPAGAFFLLTAAVAIGECALLLDETPDF